jgi:hypothetical protein
MRRSSASCPEGEPAPEPGTGFEGILRFSDLPTAERSIRVLEGLRRGFAATGDLDGLDRCRELGRLGRRRAGAIARNPRVRPAQRREKAEIAIWFEIWLETPDLFEVWLSLRKTSPGFRPRPGAGSPAEHDAA